MTEGRREQDIQRPMVNVEVLLIDGPCRGQRLKFDRLASLVVIVPYRDPEDDLSIAAPWPYMDEPKQAYYNLYPATPEGFQRCGVEWIGTVQ